MHSLDEFLGLSFDGWVAIFTALLTVATIALGYFTYMLWRATAGAVADANKSISIAQDSLDHARQAADRQLRPYVFMDVRDFEWRHGQEPSTAVALRISLTWKNMGQTPAYRVVASLSAGGFDKAIQGDWSPPDIIAPTPVGTLGPSGTVVSYVEFPITEFGPDPFLRPVYYWAWIEYDGLEEGVRHRTEICALIQRNGPPMNMTTRVWDRFETGFNGSDADSSKFRAGRIRTQERPSEA